MHTGTIKFFNMSKYFGFISIDGGDDIFLHGSEWRAADNPQEGMKVKFNIGEGRNGRSMAVEVSPI